MAKRPQTGPARNAAQPSDALLRRFTGYRMKRAYLMVEAEVTDADIDWQASFTTEFVNKGVGKDLKP